MIDAPTEKGRPLTTNQEALWRFQERQPASDVYGMLGIACTRGYADPAVMSRAWQAMLDRHEVLRSTIATDPTGEARVVPTAHGPETAMTCVDGRAWDATALARFVEERFARAHDTTGSTLFHAAMVTLPCTVAATIAGDLPAQAGTLVGLLVFTAHHLVIDFLSFPVLLRDLEAAYRGDPGEQDVVPHAHLAAWENEQRLNAAAVQRIAEYARRFAPLPDRLDFGAGGAPIDAPVDGELRFVFPEAARAAVIRFASSAGMTPFAAMLAAFGVMLQRQTGADDLCVAVPTHGRPRHGFARSVGYFANVVPLRQRIDGTLGFREHASATQASLRCALRLAAVPFPVLATQAGAHEVTPGRNVLAQVGFVWDAMPATAPEAWIDLLHVEQRGTPFALCLTGYISSTRWEFGVKHDPEVVPQPAVAAWAEDFARVATTLCERPDVPLRALALVDAPAWHARPWDAAGAAPSIETALRAHARNEAGRVVMSQGQRRITAAELERVTLRMALTLRERIPGGSRLAVLAERGCDSVLAMVAAFRAGVAYVPLHPEQTDAWLAEACRRSAVRLIACSPLLADRASSFGVPTWVTDTWIAATPAHDAGAGFTVADGQEAYVIHTSGSTGQPKAVGVSRDNLARMLQATRFIYAGADQHWTLLHHAAFDFSVWEMWGPLVHGHALRIVDETTVADPGRLHADIVSEGVTHMGMTPGACRLLLPLLREYGRGMLRTVCVGGAAVDRSLGQALSQLGIEAWSFYGPTEATVWATCGRLDADAPDGWVGMPFRGMRAYVLDNALQWVPARRIGDLYLSGGQLAHYPGLPVLSAERFVPDPWHPGERMYRTGDRAYYERSGGLCFVGRDDRQVKISGYRVELDGLAALLRGNGCFVDVACVHGREQGLVAFYTTLSGRPLEAGLLRAAAAGVLPAYVLPVRFVHRDEIPLNRNGKHDIAVLEASFLAGRAPPALEQAGEASWLNTILDFLKHELGLTAAFPDTPFHEMGAQSIALARLHDALVPSTPGLKLEDLYAFPTPMALARKLARQEGSYLPDGGAMARPTRRVLRRGRR